MFNRIKEKFNTSPEPTEQTEDEYVELSTDTAVDSDNGIIVRSYTIEDFEDIRPILQALREGYTVTLVNIRPLKDRDLIELKRAINKLKKTCDAIDGDLAGFGDDWIVATPSFAKIYRGSETNTIEE